MSNHTYSTAREFSCTEYWESIKDDTYKCMRYLGKDRIQLMMKGPWTGTQFSTNEIAGDELRHTVWNLVGDQDFITVEWETEFPQRVRVHSSTNNRHLIRNDPERTDIVPINQNTLINIHAALKHEALRAAEIELIAEEEACNKKARELTILRYLEDHLE